MGSPLVKLTLEKLAPILLLFPFNSLIEAALEEGGVFHFRGFAKVGSSSRWRRSSAISVLLICQGYAGRCTDLLLSGIR